MASIDVNWITSSFRNNQMNKASGGPHSVALYSWRRSPTRKHISSKYLPQATVGGAAIENWFRSVSLRHGNRTGQRSQLGPPNHACIESLSKGFEKFSSAEEYFFMVLMFDV